MADTTAAATPPSGTLPRDWRSLLTGRWHRSSYVSAVLVLLLLAFCNVPGQVVLELDVFYSDLISQRELEHGWPLTWAVRVDHSWPFSAFSAWRSPNCWTVWSDSPEIHWRALALNVATAVALSLLGGAAFELWRRARVRLWHVHLRELLALVLLLSLAGGWYATQQRRRAHEVWAIGEPIALAAASIDTKTCSHGIQSYSVAPGGPTWLRELLGEQHLQFLDRVTAVKVDRDGLAWAAELPDVRVVEVGGSITSASLSHLSRMPRLEALEVTQESLAYWSAILGSKIPAYGDSVPDDPRPELSLPSLPHLRSLRIDGARCEGVARLTALEHLSLSNMPVSELLRKEVATLPRLMVLTLSDCALLGDSLKQLSTVKTLHTLELNQTTIADERVGQLAALRQLFFLKITNCPLTGSGLVHLAPLTELQWLDLSHTSVDDDAVQHLAGLKNLKTLNLCATKVTPRAIPLLAKLKQLRHLMLPAAGFSDADSQRLKAELPDCYVDYVQ